MRGPGRLRRHGHRQHHALHGRGARHDASPAMPRCAPTAPRCQANARDAARRIVEMVHEDLRPRQILTEGAFRNAIATVLAVSGSINAIKHLQATAVEAESGIDVFALWEEMADVPVLSAVRPTGAGAHRAVRGRWRRARGAQAARKPDRHRRADLHRQDAGGEPRRLRDTWPGHYPPDRRSHRPGPARSPSSRARFAEHRGGQPRHPRRLAARGVQRAGARVRGRRRLHAGDRGRRDPAGDVVVARNQGLKGGPAMGGSASLVLFALDAAGLAKTTAFVTDGQLSGLCLKGLTVAEVAPEAATGGPIGKVQDGDTIRISVENRSIDLDVPAGGIGRPALTRLRQRRHRLPRQLPSGRPTDEHRRGIASAGSLIFVQEWESGVRFWPTIGVGAYRRRPAQRPFRGPKNLASAPDGGLRRSALA